MAVDFNDPCARFQALQTAYYNLISGGSESLIRIKGPNGEQEVRFSPGVVDKLKVEMDAAQNACDVSLGISNPNRRYAIRAGARRQQAQDFWTIPTWFFVP